MAQDNLVKKAWSLLTRDKGWIKPILVMPVADLVPIVGAMGTQGYALEWARLTAWGVDAAPKQKNVQVGKCIAAGARAFVVGLGFACALWILLGLLQLILLPLPEEIRIVFSALLGMLQFCVNVAYATFMPICLIRSAIYESIGAGYRVDRVCQMIRRDSSGFMKLVAINLAVSLIFGAIAFIAVMMGMVFVIPAVMIATGAESLQASMMAALPLIAIGAIFIMVVVYGMSVLAHMYALMFYTVIALWMRQFNVPAWGKSGDPLPEAAREALQVKDDSVPQRDNAARDDSEPKIEIVGAVDEGQAPAQEQAPVESESDVEELYSRLNDLMHRDDR